MAPSLHKEQTTHEQPAGDAPVQQQKHQRQQQQQQEEEAPNREKAAAEEPTGGPASSSFFSRVYSLPVVRDAVTSVNSAAEKTVFTSALLDNTKSLTRRAAASLSSYPRIAPRLQSLDTLACRSLDRIEARYPDITRPTSELYQSVHNYYKSAREAYPALAYAVDTTYNAASTVLSAVDSTVDAVLPEKVVNNAQNPEQQQQQQPNGRQHFLLSRQNGSSTKQADAEEGSQQDAHSLAARATGIACKVSSRLYERARLQSHYVKDAATYPYTYVTSMATAISTNLKDTTQSARTLASAAVSRIPSYIPHSLQPYYHSSKDVLTTKYHKLYAEYQRSDEDTQAKVLNIIRIAGEQVPFLERITENFYEKAAHAKFPLPSDSASKDSSNPPPPPPPAEKQKY